MAKPEDQIQRSVLPIPDVTPIGLTTFDAKDPDTKYPPIRPIHPPAGAPNVLVILIDDAQGEFEVLFRFYGPDKSLFEKKTWRLPDVAKV